MSLDRLAHANVRATLETWLDSHTKNSFPFFVRDPSNVEVAVAAPLWHSDDICLCDHLLTQHDPHGKCDHCTCAQPITDVRHVGKIDLLANLAADPDVLCPVDHKTTYRIDGKFVAQYIMDSQLSGYLFDAAYLTSRPAHTMVAFINAIELSVLPSSNRKCAVHATTYDECGPLHINAQVIGPIERTAAQIEAWRADAVDLAARFHRFRSLPLKHAASVPLEGTFNGGCGYCEYKEWCAASRNARQAERMFTSRPWRPWDATGQAYEPTTLCVDNSILKSVAACSTQAWVRYSHHLTAPEQSGPLNAGTAVHAGLEAWFKGGTVAQALDAFDASFIAS